MSEHHSTAPDTSDKPARPSTTPATPARKKHQVPLPEPRGSRSKPEKPRPDFPLYAHAAGVWAKRIRGKLHYFGPWEDPEAAEARYNEQKEALHAGRKPREDAEAATVKSVVNHFLNHKAGLVESGELSAHTFAKYKTATDLLIAHFGKSRLVTDLRADDFAALRKLMAKKWGIYRLGDMIQTVRSIFGYAAEADLIDRPVRFGPGFQLPTKQARDRHRAEQGPKLFSAEEVRALVQGALVVGAEGPELVKANPSVRAMLLLGINCGFGNSDCGNLPLSAADLEGGIIDFPRPKTGKPRRCPLWPETIAALREALAVRPTPKREDDAGRFFLTRLGQSWAKDKCTSPLVLEFRKLLKRLGINGRKRLGFYTLRHTLRTVADAAKDQPAADYLMGHEVAHMSSVYRETIAAERLKAVSDHVRAWLFPPKESRAAEERQEG
jgi:integrase